MEDLRSSCFEEGELGRDAESPNNAEPALDLPLHIRQQLDNPSYHPRYGEVPVLSEAAEQELIERFGHIYSITNKFHLGVVLAYGGGDRALSVLSNALTQEYNGKSLTPEENALLPVLLMRMGVMARRSDRAFAFLKQCVEPDFWQEHCRWTCADETKDRTILHLVQCALEGLAVTGRPEALDVFTEIRNRPVERWPTQYRGAVAQAVWMHGLFVPGGLLRTTNVSWSLAEDWGLFVQWWTSTNGEAWRTWATPGSTR